jgi:hypothetical protein
MKRFFKQDLEQWVRKLQEALWFLGEHAFVAMILFILGSGLIAAFLFYEYVALPSHGRETSIPSEFQLEEQIFDNLLLQLKKEEENVRNADLFKPRDLFNP